MWELWTEMMLKMWTREVRVVFFWQSLVTFMCHLLWKRTNKPLLLFINPPFRKPLSCHTNSSLSSQKHDALQNHNRNYVILARMSRLLHIQREEDEHIVNLRLRCGRSCETIKNRALNAAKPVLGAYTILISSLFRKYFHISCLDICLMNW